MNVKSTSILKKEKYVLLFEKRTLGLKKKTKKRNNSRGKMERKKCLKEKNRFGRKGTSMFS